jgi:hypothetical protein
MSPLCDSTRPSLLTPLPCPQVIAALRFVQSHRLVEPQRPLVVPCKRFLEAAALADDLTLFNVVEFLQQWLATHKPGASLMTEDGCARYAELYQQKFGRAAFGVADESAAAAATPTAPLSPQSMSMMGGADEL